VHNKGKVNLLPLSCSTLISLTMLFIFACMQGIIMQIFNGCFNSHVLALSQAYAAAARVKMLHFYEDIVSHGLLTD